MNFSNVEATDSLDRIYTPQKTSEEKIKDFFNLPEDQLEQLLKLSEDEIFKKIDLTKQELEPYFELPQEEFTQKLDLTIEKPRKFLAIAFKMRDFKQITPMYRSPMDERIVEFLSSK